MTSKMRLFNINMKVRLGNLRMALDKQRCIVYIIGKSKKKGKRSRLGYQGYQAISSATAEETMLGDKEKGLATYPVARHVNCL